jgi:hypothetical protein
MPTTYAIPDGRVAMAATTYTGTGAALTVSNAVNGTSFQPDLVWIKSRVNNPSGGALNHVLTDVVRGVTKELNSNNTGAETTNSAGLTTFNSNGFSVGGDYNYNNPGNGGAMVGWQWKANGAAVTNTAGSITSQVSANTAAGFSVVTWTGTGANATVGHGLGVAPSMMILMNRDTTHDNIVWHTAFTATERIYLNYTDAKDPGAATSFNSTRPSSSVISLGSNLYTNGSTNKMVAYCWAAVPGYSAFGSYTGNGSADGAFVYLGFRPRWILFKDSTNAATNWVLQDTSRFTYNLVAGGLLANTSASEYSSGYDVDILSNGFKIRRSGGDTNASGATYIYAAFAETAFKFANAR